MHGEGTLKKSNGEKFKGTFQNGKKEGSEVTTKCSQLKMMAPD